MVLVPHLQGISWDNDQCFAAGIETTSQMHPHLGIISPTTNYPEKYDWLLVGVYPHCIPIRAHYFHGFFNHKPVHVAIPNVFLGLKTMKIQKKIRGLNNNPMVSWCVNPVTHVTLRCNQP